jgi:hypothetical protein
MIGTNTVLHLQEGTAMIGSDALQGPLSGYISRLFSYLCEIARRHNPELSPGFAILGPIFIERSFFSNFDFYH